MQRPQTLKRPVEILGIIVLIIEPWIKPQVYQITQASGVPVLLPPRTSTGCEDSGTYSSHQITIKVNWGMGCFSQLGTWRNHFLTLYFFTSVSCTNYPFLEAFLKNESLFSLYFTALPLQMNLPEWEKEHLFQNSHIMYGCEILDQDPSVGSSWVGTFETLLPPETWPNVGQRQA